MKSLKLIFLVINLLIHSTSPAQVLLYTNGIDIINSTTLYIGGSILAGPGTSISNNGTIQLKGNWTNNSTPTIFNTTNGTVEFSGSNQVIGGVTGTNFHNLSFTGNSNYYCNQPISTGGDGPIQNGILSLNSSILLLNSNMLYVKNTSPLAISRSTGFIDGETTPLAGISRIKWKVGSAPALSTYIFPFGNQSSNSFLPTTISFYYAALGPNGTIIASTYPTDPYQSPNNRPLPQGIPSINDIYGNDNSSKMLDRFWTIDFENFIISLVGTYFFTYRDSEHNTGNNSISESSLRAQKFTNTWNSIPSGGLVVTSLNSCGITNITGLSSGTWALTDLSSPLPIELLSFSANTTEENTVKCEWITSAELNNDFFTIERGSSPQAFEEIGRIDGAGHSSEINTYTFIDPMPLNGINYYRLKQSDFDGSFTYSKVVAVKFHSTSQLRVTPNPTFGSFDVLLERPLSSNGILLIQSSEGKLIFEKKLDIIGLQKITIPEIKTSKGTYFVTVITEFGIQRCKIVVL